MRSLVLVLIQYDWLLIWIGHRSQREDHVMTQGKDGHLQAKGRWLRRNQPCGHLNVGLLLLERWENKCLWCKPHNLCYGSPCKQHNWIFHVNFFFLSQGDSSLFSFLLQLKQNTISPGFYHQCPHKTCCLEQNIKSGNTSKSGNSWLHIFSYHKWLQGLG